MAIHWPHFRLRTSSYLGSCSPTGGRPKWKARSDGQERLAERSSLGGAYLARDEAGRKETAVDKAYLEDLAPGQVFTSPARAVVGADAIKRFAGEFDPQPWHLNETIARSTFFKELVASGWHTTALTMQLIIQTLPLSEGIIGSGVDELRWPRPVRPGDTLRLHCEIIEVQESKLRPSRGTVRVRTTTLNQHDQPVQTMVANLLAFRRSGEATGSVS
jgi:acyl dehydratase